MPLTFYSLSQEVRQNESKKGKQVGADDDDDEADNPESSRDVALFGKKRKMGAGGGPGNFKNRSFAKKR